MFTIDWNRYRLVDVTLCVVPGESDRRLALRRYVFPVDGSFGNEVDTVTHLGTHVEAPAHYYEDGSDVTVYPPERFMGPMVHLRFDIAPRVEITEPMIRKAAAELDLAGRIAVLSTPHLRRSPEDDRRPVLTHEAAHFLIESGIKAMGFDDSLTIDTSAELAQSIHHELFDNDAVLFEYMGQLDQLRRRESYLIALPLRVVGFDSSPVRAVVIEEI